MQQEPQQFNPKNNPISPAGAVVATVAPPCPPAAVVIWDPVVAPSLNVDGAQVSTCRSKRRTQIHDGLCTDLAAALLCRVTAGTLTVGTSPPRQKKHHANRFWLKPLQSREHCCTHH